MNVVTWGDKADDVLRILFADGRKPTDKQISAAYPFGERAMWPYKVWLARVKWWKAGCPPRIRKVGMKPLPGQEAML